MIDALDWMIEVARSSSWYWRIAYGWAFGLWICAFMITWDAFGRAFWHVRRKDSPPFVLRSLWIVTIGAMETGFYAGVVWFAEDDARLRWIAAMLLPVLASAQALATIYFIQRAKR